MHVRTYVCMYAASIEGSLEFLVLIFDEVHHRLEVSLDHLLHERAEFDFPLPAEF